MPDEESKPEDLIAEAKAAADALVAEAKEAAAKVVAKAQAEAAKHIEAAKAQVVDALKAQAEKALANVPSGFVLIAEHELSKLRDIFFKHGK